ncbi:MAG: HAD family hydrolase [Gemmataceae bacterium]|nr:HAD family hydrolase [Gemmataceae bacterium]
MIELVVFDMAGTTVYDGDAVNNSFRAALLCQAASLVRGCQPAAGSQPGREAGTLAGAGVEADPALVNTVMGLPKPEAIRRLLAAAGRPSPEGAVAAIHEDFVKRMRHYYTTDPAVREVPGAADTFAVLRRAGIKVALNTGFNRAVVEVLLARLGWHAPEVIDAVVTSDEVPRGRPYPDMIRLLMDRLGVQDARKVAKVGDTEADLAEGTNAGCGLVIGVTSGSYPRERLQPHPHTHILESVIEVPGVVLP